MTRPIATRRVQCPNGAWKDVPAYINAPEPQRAKVTMQDWIKRHEP